MSGYGLNRITGSLFAKRLEDAVQMRKTHTEAFKEFSSLFPDKAVEEWTHAVSEWESNRNTENPFAEKLSCTYHFCQVKITSIYA